MKRLLSILDFVKEAVLYVWQLPQNLLGLLALIIYRDEKEYHILNGRRFYYTQEMTSGISLGNYIIMSCVDEGDGMRHEYGHSIQSRILGPLYLILIGFPSLLWNVIDGVFVVYAIGCERSMKLYYRMPWEWWADKLGGVVRHFE